MTTIILCSGTIAALVLLVLVYAMCRVSGMCSEAEERRALLMRMEEQSRPKITGEL